jgi:type IV secretory pathway VirB10-like protein
LEEGMALRKFAVMLPVAALLAGCQSDQKKSAREQELEQRVQDLEKQIFASAMPTAPPSALADGQTGLQALPEAYPQETAQPAPVRRTAPAPVVRTQTVRPQATRTRTARTETTRTATSRPPSGRTASRGEVSGRPVDHERMEDTPSAHPVGDDDSDSDDVLETRATRLVLPEGTELTLVLETPVSSAGSNEGDAVTARVERAVSEDGRIVLPGGTVLQGRVTEAQASGRVKGRARVAVDFDRIVVRGRTHEFDAAPLVAEAAGGGGSDARMVGGGAAAGAIIGAIADGKKGALKGAVIGAGAGGAAVLATKGKDVEMPAGSRWTVRLRNSLRL